ncbi:MAG: hypothetical protein HGA44_04290 [Cellulomonadaceae bacterium]|nr:hypothetical protein [Cellulomonadaceae bacterium]
MSISGISSAYPTLRLVTTAATTQATSTTSATTTGSAQAVTRPHDGAGKVPGHIEAAAQVLGLSTDDVMEALEGGSSLADLAEEQGVSRDELVQAIVEAAPQDMRSIGNLDEMVGHLVDQAGTGRPSGPPPADSTGVFGSGLTASQEDTVSALSDLLGTDSSTLLDVLRNGTSLADLLSDAGVSTDDLADVIEQGLLIDTSA